MNIILASASPRRKEILENVNVKFTVVASNIDEVILDNEPPKELVMRLAFEKCMDVARKNEDALVIGADTIVVMDDQILGKPKNEEDAYNMIELLSNKKHQVITGISLINLSLDKKVIDYVVSEVTFKDLSKETIRDYINTKESLDKAGAYGIQGYGSLLVESISGDYFNIVGLPISRISDLLKEHFNVNLFYGG
ncbi:septum formation inhibitor Maf [Romboutsia sp. CE17]|uniref:Maf family protein n=1 Tax=Romboutsia sp. CE17 TaxID=2724150 RepID=UPI001442A577|nr:Maf family protein [Romboutsia sp. CE17]QJA07947.1 septum formation inhibitor Maf [Romboutsia sp. CE17]